MNIHLGDHVIKSPSQKLPYIATLFARWVMASSSQNRENHATPFHHFFPSTLQKQRQILLILFVISL